MALLKGAFGLSLGSARLFASLGRLQPLSSAAGSAGFNSTAQGSESNIEASSLQRTLSQQRQQELFDKLRINLPTQVLAARKEEEQKQQNALACSPLAMPMLPARGRAGALAALAGRKPSAVALPHQVRHYNAWSPAQRYFVEGEHVITSEINRTFQFTGLDSGSFYPFVVYTAVATIISSVFMVLPLLVAPTRVDLDKSSAYECGFDAFGEARQTFSVSFYLVSIMYLLFDIEIAYLFPYVMSHANVQMFWTMNLFLGILVVGFIYEWGVGALEWRE